MPPRDLDPRITALIRLKAAQLARSPSFLRRDVEDIRQELSLHVVRRMPRHDRLRASEVTYADRILTNNVTDLVRRARAQRRDQSREVPADRLPVRGLEELRTKGWGHDRHVHLRLNLYDALAMLGEDDREIALSLVEQNVAEVCRRTGRSRQAVRSAKLRVRRHLERCGVAA
jgi:DNA-directed RNA polymerase specialized sigma24 family protein